MPKLKLSLAAMLLIVSGCGLMRPTAPQPAPRPAKVDAPAVARPPMPDPKLTPGAIRSDATIAELCDPTFRTRPYRHVTEREREFVYREYGMTPYQGACANGCELDHLIPLELGGSNDVKNLWPEPYQPHPGAYQKDRVENWLKEQVCAGRMTLPDAQHRIATDWFAIFLQQFEKSPHAG